VILFLADICQILTWEIWFRPTQRIFHCQISKIIQLLRFYNRFQELVENRRILPSIFWPCFGRQGYIVFRFIIKYSTRLNGFWPLGSRSIFIWGFLKDDILACVETWD
jgi:hypothetical protein